MFEAKIDGENGSCMIKASGRKIDVIANAIMMCEHIIREISNDKKQIIYTTEAFISGLRSALDLND